MTGKKTGSPGDRRSSFSEMTQTGRNLSAELTNTTSECLAKMADLQADATRTVLAEATIAARELSTAATPAQLMLVLMAQAHRSAARMLNLDGQLAHVAGALHAVCNRTLQSQAAGLMHPFLTPLLMPGLIETKIAIEP